MRRALRLLIATAVILSTVVCVMAVLCWRVESGFLQYAVDGPRPWLFWSHEGTLTIERYENPEMAVHFREGWATTLDDAMYSLPTILEHRRTSPAWYRRTSIERLEVQFMTWRKGRKVLSWRESGYQFNHLGYLGAGGSLKMVAFSISYPLLATLSALPGLLRVSVRFSSRWRSGRKRAPGLCIGCGYDLRATPERCPECGRRI